MSRDISLETSESGSRVNRAYRLMGTLAAIDGKIFEGGLTHRVGSNLGLSELVHAAIMKPVMRLQRQALRRGEEEVRIPFCGYRLHLDLRSVMDYAAYLSFQESGSYEPATVRELLSRIEPGDTFVDVGANSGILTLAAASRVGDGGRVIAFEPQPEARRRLLRNVSDNDLEHVVEVRPDAVSDRGGTASISISNVCDGLSGVRDVKPLGRSINVPTTTLDAAVATLTPSLIKIDVEGGEEAVLRGAGRTLAGVGQDRRPVLIVEWNSLYAGRSLWSRLWAHGKVYLLREVTGPPEPAQRDGIPWGRGCNLLVVPISRN